MYREGRLTRRDNSDPTADDLFIVGTDEDRIFKNFGFEILNAKFGPIEDTSTPDRDLNLMKKVLDAFQLSGLRDLRSDVLLADATGGVPLIYSLLQDVNLTTSWKQPSISCLNTVVQTRGMNYSSVDEVAWREITIGRSSDTEIRAFQDWILDNQQLDLNDFNSPFTSFKLVTVYVSRGSFSRLCNKYSTWSKNPAPEYVPVFDVKDQGLMKLPARLLFGNGSTWIGSVKLNFTEVMIDERRHFKLSLGTLSSTMIKLLEKLPLLCGHDAVDSRDLLESTLNQMYRVKVKLPHAMELRNLALLAGWKERFLDMSTMACVVTGEVISHVTDNADQSWTKEYQSLPREFQAYAITVVRHCFSSYIILMGLIIRNLFPDPDIVCDVLELTQTSAIAWITGFVSTCLRESIPYQEALSSATTRQELVLSIRKWTYSSSTVKRMRREPEESTKVLAAIIPNWPCVPRGGARYLHSTRSDFVRQFELLQKVEYTHPSVSPNLTKPMTDQVKLTYLYGRGTSMTDGGDPTNGEFGLLPNPQSADTIYQLDPDVVSDGDLMHPQTQYDQNLIPALQEWARLNPQLISDLFQRLNKLPITKPHHFWMDRTRAYDSIRLIQLRVMDISVCVPAIDSIIRSRLQNVEDQETRTELKRIQENQEKRVNVLVHKQSYLGSVPRTGIHQSIYDQIPGDFHSRNKQWAVKRKQRNDRLKASRPYHIPKRLYKQLKQSGELSTYLQEHRQDRDVPEVPGDDDGRKPALKSSDLRFRLQKRAHSPELKLNTDLRTKLTSKSSNQL